MVRSEFLDRWASLYCVSCINNFRNLWFGDRGLHQLVNRLAIQSPAFEMDVCSCCSLGLDDTVAMNTEE